MKYGITENRLVMAAFIHTYDRDYFLTLLKEEDLAKVGYYFAAVELTANGKVKEGNE